MHGCMDARMLVSRKGLIYAYAAQMHTDKNESTAAFSSLDVSPTCLAQAARRVVFWRLCRLVLATHYSLVVPLSWCLVCRIWQRNHFW
jgi:hypothetical protein